MYGSAPSQAYSSKMSLLLRAEPNDPSRAKYMVQPELIAPSQAKCLASLRAEPIAHSRAYCKAPSKAKCMVRVRAEVLLRAELNV